MLKLLKKSLIILLLIIMNIIVSLAKIIYKFYEKNKSKMQKISKNFYTVLKEEISK